MRALPLRLLISLAVVVAAPSCASKERVWTIPVSLPAADLKVEPEPAYPAAALAPCPTDSRADACPAEDAERDHSDAALIWGRAGWAKVKRLCQFARGIGQPLPEGWCG